VGLVYALSVPDGLRLPSAAFHVGQAIAGVAVGTFLELSVLTGLGASWIPVILVSLATLAVTVVVGLMVSRITDLDRPTASLGMVAGGASGIVAMAGELGGDERLVAFMQYLRVLVVALLTPLLVPLAFGIHSHAVDLDQGPVLGTTEGWSLTIGGAVGGTLIGRALRFPAPAFLGPMVLVSALTLSGLADGVQVPPVVRETGFALIGLRIGLEFDRQTLRRIRRVAVPVAASLAALLGACFLLGWILDLTAGVSLLDGYLATTPGGLFAVLPIAYGSGANTTFVLAVQGLRLLAMVLAAPALVRWMLGRRPEPLVTHGGRADA
jgi:uncharacterized protein